MTQLKSESNNGGSDSSYPIFSIIIEWENIINSQEWIAVKMLQQLSKQIIEISVNLSSKAEVIIVYNSENFEHCQMEQFVNEPLEPCGSMIDLKIIPATKLDYFELKNYGVRQSHGDIIIFIDSDVIPEEGWLVAMLEPFQNPETSVVSGLESAPKSIYEKAFAAYSGMFSESEFDDQIQEVELFHANSVAFRREIFVANPFPCLPQYRGQSDILAGRLRLQGHKILCQPKSKTYHPPPRGLRGFVTRALCQGHDLAVYRRRARKENKEYLDKKFPLTSARIMLRRFSPYRIFLHYRNKLRSLRIAPKDKVGTVSIVLLNLLIMYIGYQVTFFKPEFLRRHIPSY